MNAFWLKQWLDLGLLASSAEIGWKTYGVRWVDKRLKINSSYKEVFDNNEAVDELSTKELTRDSAKLVAGLVSDMLNSDSLSIADLKDLNSMNKDIQNSFIKGAIVSNVDVDLEKFRRSLVC